MFVKVFGEKSLERKVPFSFRVFLIQHSNSHKRHSEIEQEVMAKQTSNT